MAQKTIEYILSLKTKDGDKNKLVKDFDRLQKEANDLQKAMKEAVDPKQADKLAQELAGVNNQIKKINQEAGKQILSKQLEEATKQASRLEELGGKMTQVGGILGGTGAAILAPIALLANKYVEVYGETEETGKKLVGLSKEWEDVQLRIGRIAAEQLLPLLEKGVDFAEKVADFVEANPGVIKAGLGIGGTLATMGALLATAGTVVQTLAAVQKIGSFAGIAGGTGGAGALSGIGAAIGPALTSALTAAAPVIVPILALAIGAEIGRQLVSLVAGEEYTWQQIGQDFKNLLVMSAEGWDVLFNWLGIETNISGILADAMGTSDLFLIEKMEAQGEEQTGRLLLGMKEGIMAYINTVKQFWTNIISSITRLAQTIGGTILAVKTTIETIIEKLRSSVVSAINNTIGKLIALIPRKAMGGDIGAGLFMGGEAGREFMLSNKTTRSAEALIGGRLTQDKLLQALAGNRVQYFDSRRFEATPSQFDRKRMVDETIRSLSGVFQ